MDAAWDLGVTTLDTSPNYGISEERISNFLKLNPSKNFDIISKVKSVNEGAQQGASVMGNWLNESPLFDVNTANSISVLLHNEDDIRHTAVIDAIQKFQMKGYFSCWGVSVYSKAAAVESLDIDSCQIIQLPFGILNQSFQTDGILKTLSDHNKTILARSIFTQGLLFGHKLEAPPITEEVYRIKQIIRDLSDRRGLTLMQYAMSFVLSFDWVDSIVVGVDTVKQLNEALECPSSTLNEDELNVLYQNSKSLSPDAVRPETWN